MHVFTSIFKETKEYLCFVELCIYPIQNLNTTAYIRVKPSVFRLLFGRREQCSPKTIDDIFKTNQPHAL